MSGPPEKPWVTGVHPTHKAFRLTVSICEDANGNIWSEHDFASAEDALVAQGLRYWGVPQVAHAMLSEAVFREVYTSALLKFGQEQGAQALGQWAAEDAAGRKVIEDGIAKVALHVLSVTVPKMLPTAVPGVLAMLHAQQVAGPSGAPGG